MHGYVWPEAWVKNAFQSAQTTSRMMYWPARVALNPIEMVSCLSSYRSVCAVSKWRDIVASLTISNAVNSSVSCVVLWCTAHTIMTTHLMVIFLIGICVCVFFSLPWLQTASAACKNWLSVGIFYRSWLASKRCMHRHAHSIQWNRPPFVWSMNWMSQLSSLYFFSFDSIHSAVPSTLNCLPFSSLLKRTVFGH